uniref:Transposase n=1 Tax=Saccharolobus solfataricus TaxID=2287 RepID=O74034_SACSO|nr:transposase [Saccharolobus solfataricus]
MLESRKEGFSARKFAELIKRHPSTVIYRELKRNSINDVYLARYASDNTFARLDCGTENSKSIQSSGNLLLLKAIPWFMGLSGNTETLLTSRVHVTKEWEPLKKDLLSCLRHVKKAVKRNWKNLKKILYYRINNYFRCDGPSRSSRKKNTGHWERDLIKWKDNKSSIRTFIDLKIHGSVSSEHYLMAKGRIRGRGLTEALKYLPAERAKTLTYDRGREMAEHKILEEDLGIDVYFCDPHSPWQKGTCENMNGLIRQYLPKGIDLNQADQHYLNQVAMSLNTRPRKALVGFTIEKFAQLVVIIRLFKLSHLMF